MKKTKKVSLMNISDWVGNYGCGQKREEWMLQVIYSLVNGECDPKAFGEEIKDYCN